MSDEIKQEKECKCFCHSKGFKKFLTVAIGTFVGVYCALCLFTALHKPPMIIPAPFGYQSMQGCPCQMHHKHHYDRIGRHGKGDFKQVPQKNFERKTPFEAQRAEED